MHRMKIRLDTKRDVEEFFSIVSSSEVKGKVKLVDGNNEFMVDGKSKLGVLLAYAEWSELYCISEEDLYTKLEKFVVLHSNE